MNRTPPECVTLPIELDALSDKHMVADHIQVAANRTDELDADSPVRAGQSTSRGNYA